MDKISIIIPIYNCEEYLEECLNSIVNQTFKNYEVIMINDGTKDNSVSICNKYKKKYSFKFIDRKDNKGLAYTRNEGIRNATGTYIMFLDSDDLLYESALEILYKNIKANNADVVISKINSFNSKGTYGYYSDKYLKKNQSTTLLNNKKLINCISVCAKLYKKDLLKDIKFIENTYHEDNYFTLKVLTKSNKINILNKYTYYRRIREGANLSIMQNLNYKTFFDLIYNFEMYLKESQNNYDFVDNFMIRKSINYIVMNINDKIEYKRCKCKWNDFYKKIYNKKNGLKKYLLRLKYGLYFLIAICYKKLKICYTK